MFKLAKSSIALLLGLIMAMALLVPGAFAKSVDAHHGSTPSAPQAQVSMQLHQQHHQANWWYPGYWGSGWGWDDCGC